MAQEPLTPRQLRGDALRRLGVRFKSGDTAERRSDDLAKLDTLGIDTLDLLEAVERIELTRQTTTYPPLADLLIRCREALSDRRIAQKQLTEHSSEDPTTDAERTQMSGIMTLYRAGQIWCPVCRAYRAHCADHCDATGRSATPQQTTDAVAALPAGPPRPLASTETGLTRVADSLDIPF